MGAQGHSTQGKHKAGHRTGQDRTAHSTGQASAPPHRGNRHTGHRPWQGTRGSATPGSRRAPWAGAQGRQAGKQAGMTAQQGTAGHKGTGHTRAYDRQPIISPHTRSSITMSAQHQGHSAQHQGPAHQGQTGRPAQHRRRSGPVRLSTAPRCCPHLGKRLSTPVDKVIHTPPGSTSPPGPLSPGAPFRG